MITTKHVPICFVTTGQFLTRWEEKGGQLVAKGGAGKGKEFCVLTAVSVGSVHKQILTKMYQPNFNSVAKTIMTLCSRIEPVCHMLGISPTLTTAEQITVKHMQVQQKREHYA